MMLEYFRSSWEVAVVPVELSFPHRLLHNKQYRAHPFLKVTAGRQLVGSTRKIYSNSLYSYPLEFALLTASTNKYE